MAIEFDPNKRFEAVGSPQVAAPTFDANKPFDAGSAAAPPPEPGLYDKIKDTLARGSRRIPILGTAMNPVAQDLALRAYDYAGGAVRTGLGALTGQVTQDDLINTAKGKAPRLNEYAKRAGVPEGPKDPFLGISARDAGGFIGDVATDPLTYVAPLNRFLGAGAAAEAAGKTMYKSGLKRIDEETARYGKEPVSDLLMKNRVTGGYKSIANQMDQLADKRLAERQAILERATQEGANVDIYKAMQVPQDYVSKLQAINNPEQIDALKTLNERIGTYAARAGTPISPVQASSWKSSAANRVGDKNWEAMAYAPEGKQFEKELSKGLRKATEASVGETLGADAATALQTKNDELGRLLTTQDRAEQMARIDGRKNLFTSVDGMMLGGALAGEGHGNHDFSMIGLAKKLADAAKATGPRTVGGLALQDLGKTPIPDALARRVLIDESNPWNRLRGDR